MKELWERFGSGPEDAPNAPPLPEWCFEEEEASDNEDNDDDSLRNHHDNFDRKRAFDGVDRSAKRRRKEHHVKVYIHLRLIGIFEICQYQYQYSNIVTINLIDRYI